MGGDIFEDKRRIDFQVFYAVQEKKKTESIHRV